MDTYDKLTDKQRRFVDAYLVGLIASSAARAAGYSKKRPDVAGAKLLGKPRVQAAISERMAVRAERTEIKQHQVVRELARIAFADLREIMEWGPEGVVLKSSAQLTDRQAAAIAEVSETKTEHGGTLRVKLVPKDRALEMLGRHLAMFTDSVKLKSGVETLTDEQLNARITELLRKNRAGAVT